MRLHAEPVSEQEILQQRILVVDDIVPRRERIARILTRDGYRHVLQSAEGCDALQRLADSRPELVLLDVTLSGQDGFAVCRAMRACDGAVPILLQTTFLGPHERAIATDAGATDFLTKPIHAAELLARARMHLVNRLLLRRLQLFRRRLDDELHAARTTQESLLPSAAVQDEIRAALGIDVAGYAEMSSELGGDIWGLRAIDETRLSLFMADFSGHGIDAALNAVRLHTLLSEQSLVSRLFPDHLLQTLNQRLAALLPCGTFATMFCGLVDLERDRLEYAAAGAPPPLLHTRAGGVSVVDSTGLPLGTRRQHLYPRRSVEFPPGATLLLYSDALLETPDNDGAVWQPDTLGELFGQLDHTAPAAATMHGLLASFLARRTPPFPDDVTLVCLRRR